MPASNRPHLMLRRDVVDAVRAGRFHVHAVTLASRFGADLDALLLAQAELIRAAELPFATEVSLLVGMERRLSAALMQRRLQQLTGRVQAMLAELAAPVKVHWSLRVAGRAQWEGLLAAPGEGSLLVVAQRGHYPPMALAMVKSTCVVGDGSAAGRAAEALAGLLDPQAARLVLSPVPDGAAGQRPGEGILAELRRLRPQTLILPAGSYAVLAGDLRALLARLECTLLLVG